MASRTHGHDDVGHKAEIEFGTSSSTTSHGILSACFLLIATAMDVFCDLRPILENDE